jgi:hypothetical protein
MEIRVKNLEDPLYNVYTMMIHRCYAPSNPNYPNYGLRGIRVCPEWMPDDEGSGRGFWQFVKDMGPRPDGHFRKRHGRRKPRWTLERKDNDGDYSPHNCIWSTTSAQQRNRRNWRWGEGLKIISGAKDVRPSPFARNRFTASSFQVKWWDGAHWVFTVLCNSHLSKLRQYRIVELTGVSFPAAYCRMCRDGEGDESTVCGRDRFKKLDHLRLCRLTTISMTLATRLGL